VAIGIGAMAMLLVGGPAFAGPTATDGPQIEDDPFAAIVTEAAQRSGIPSAWIRAVMQAESGGDVWAVSPKGAMGLMQILPETWATLRLRYGLGADPFDPHDNILAGAAYLRELHDRYGSPGFLAAYNAGPARYEDHVATGQPLPAETRAYVALLTPMVGDGVIDDTTEMAVAVRSWTEAPLFTVHAEARPATDQAHADKQAEPHRSGAGAQELTTFAPQSGGLFVQRSQRNPRP
jgi:hypothetical protein